MIEKIGVVMRIAKQLRITTLMRQLMITPVRHRPLSTTDGLPLPAKPLQRLPAECRKKLCHGAPLSVRCSRSMLGAGVTTVG